MRVLSASGRQCLGLRTKLLTLVSKCGDLARRLGTQSRAGFGVVAGHVDLARAARLCTGYRACVFHASGLGEASSFHRKYVTATRASLSTVRRWEVVGHTPVLRHRSTRRPRPPGPDDR